MNGIKCFFEKNKNIEKLLAILTRRKKSDNLLKSEIKDILL